MRVYVDDMIIIDNSENIQVTKKILAQNFNMKDMGLADVIHGMKISEPSDGYSLSQCHYILKILDMFDRNSDVIAKKNLWK